MSQLVKAIGMTKGAIYGNFKDKDELAFAALDYNLSKLIWERLEKIKKNEKDANNRIISFVSFNSNDFTDLSNQILKSGGCPMLNGIVDSEFTHEKLKEYIRIAVKKWLESIENIIRDGIEAKQIKEDIDPKYYASLFGSLIEGGQMLHRATGDLIHLEFNIRHVTHIINTQLRA